MDIFKIAKSVSNKYGATYEERLEINSICLEVSIKIKDKLNKVDNPKDYLYKSMIREVILYLKDRKKNSLLSLSAIDEYIDMETSIIDVVSKRIQIQKFLNSLTEKELEVVILLVKGYTFNEIGKKLGVTKGSLLTKVSRKREKWRQFFNEE